MRAGRSRSTSLRTDGRARLGRPFKRRRSLIRPGTAAGRARSVRRNFTAVAPDVLWCGDVTQIDTHEGPLYLATVEDLFSRRILRHAMSEHHDAALAVASLQMASTTKFSETAESITTDPKGSWGPMRIFNPAHETAYRNDQAAPASQSQRVGLL